MPDNDFVSVRLESTAFSCAELNIRSLHGTERISQLFSFDLELYNLNTTGLDLDAVSGAEATLVFERSGVELRRVHGLLCDVEDMLTVRATYRGYRARLVPRAARLSLVQTQEVYLQKSVPDIVTLKADLVSLDVDTRLFDTYPARDFVVQFKETDLHFLSRLTEHLGISYIFETKDNLDRLVFVDYAEGFHTLDGYENITFRNTGDRRDVFDLSLKRTLVPNVYSIRDYNEQTPTLDLTASQEASGFFGGVDEYGPNAATQDESARFARVRSEEKIAMKEVVSGQSDLCYLTAGAKFTLQGHPSYSDRQLLITEIVHDVTQTVATMASTDSVPYSNQFKALDATLTFRPPRVTHRPHVAGLVAGFTQAATGATDKYAEIDEQGRYSVRFVFDIAGGDHTPGSLPLRKMEPFIGGDSGMHFPLRPGVEVLIAFINGDVDRPVIVGAVANATTPTMIARPDRTVHRIKTASGIIIDASDGT